MRRLALAGALSLLALAGCGGGGRSPTEPGGRPARGNWIGTISGTHADLGVQGTCDFELNLDANFDGRWWIDCPRGASSEGQALGFDVGFAVAFVFISTRPASNCSWAGFATKTATTIDGDFQVTDCTTNTIRSTGTFALRKR